MRTNLIWELTRKVSCTCIINLDSRIILNMRGMMDRNNNTLEAHRIKAIHHSLIRQPKLPRTLTFGPLMPRRKQHQKMSSKKLIFQLDQIKIVETKLAIRISNSILEMRIQIKLKRNNQLRIWNSILIITIKHKAVRNQLSQSHTIPT